MDVDTRDDDVDVPALLASKMLAGGCLMATSCPRCTTTPLIRERNSDTAYCVLCEVECLTPAQAKARGVVANETKRPEQRESAGEEILKKEHGPKSLGGIHDDDFAAKRGHRQRVSDEMGRRLLRGWAMLDLHCSTPNCPTPLMREPSFPHKLFCVNCNRYEEDEPASADETSSVGELSKVDAPALNQADFSEYHNGDDAQRTGLTHLLSSASNPRTRSTSISIYLQKVHVSLLSKLEDLHKMLDQASCADLQHIRNIAAAISAVSDALHVTSSGEQRF